MKAKIGNKGRSGQRLTRREFVLALGSSAFGSWLCSCGKGLGTGDILGDLLLEDTPGYGEQSGWGPDVHVPDLSRTAFLVEGMAPLPSEPLPPRWHHPALEALLALMDQMGLPFYRSTSRSPLAGPQGLIARDDIVVVKINAQWQKYGGTNTDLLRGLLTRIVEHPDGFVGEVVVADNRQDLFTGGFDAPPNSVSPDYTVNHVVSLFKDQGVSTYYWDAIRNHKVSENGPFEDGYVVLEQGPGAGLVSYPRFTTPRGTRVDLRRGVLGPNGYEDRLRLINLPVLKSHVLVGATATLKNFMGVLDVGVMGGELMKNIHHALVYDGLMARMMLEVRRPALNILDALNVIHQPPFGPQGGSGGRFEELGHRWAGALLGGIDPVAIDHAACTEVLYPSDVVAPCGELHIIPGTTCVAQPPCLATGHCERMNPDLQDDRLLNPSFAMAALLGDAPVDALGRYLSSSSLVLHGNPEVDRETYDLVRTRIG